MSANLTPVRLLLSVVLLTVCSAAAFAQTEQKQKKKRAGAIYASWGYNTAQYTLSTLHVKQPSLGNDYQLVNVKAHDNKGWDKDLLKQQITIPQYNYRLGYYFNEKQDLAIEINFDHVKYIIADNQRMKIKGTMNNAAIDEELYFSRTTGFYYFLNNGANFLLFDFVKRLGIYRSLDRNLQVDFTGKAGIGPVIPHVENSLFGMKNNKGFQIGGWNTGLEAAIRVTLMKYAYLEFAQKLDYARYSHLRVHEGRARQSFGTYETILSLGVILPTSKNNPLFTPITKEELLKTRK